MRVVVLALLTLSCALYAAGCRGCDDDGAAALSGTAGTTGAAGAIGSAGAAGAGGNAGATGDAGAGGNAGAIGAAGTIGSGAAGSAGAAGAAGNAGTIGSGGTTGGASGGTGGGGRGGSASGGIGGGAGAGGRGGAGGAAGGTAPTEAAFITAFCDLYRPCCALMGRPADGVTCRTYFTNFPDALLPPTYDQAGGEACLAALAPASTQPGFCTNALVRAEACEVVFGIRGTKTVGQSCSVTADCVPEAFCDIPRSMCAPRLPLLAACTGIADQCVKGTYCDVDLCRTQFQKGENCAADQECVTGICSDPGPRCVDPPNTLGVSVLCGGG